MAEDHYIEIFMPPNTLKTKIGGSGRLDFSTIKRAEEAVEELSVEFAGWMIADVNRLAAALDAYEGAASAETLGALYRASLDLKGQGKTFDFALAARIASSLCRLTEENSKGRAPPMPLIDAHVDAIKIVVRDRIKNATDGVAKDLAMELERQVAEFLG